MNYMPIPLQNIFLESYFRYGWITNTIMHEVEELKDYSREEIASFFKDDIEISDTCFFRDKDDMRLPPDIKVSLTIPDKGIIKVLFYIFTCCKDDKYELPDSIEEYDRREKEDPHVINVYSHWFILEEDRYREEEKNDRI